MAITNMARMYNSLLDVKAADDSFTNREPIFKQLATILDQYDHKWGACLVHRHCELLEGEIMLETEDNITKPVQARMVKEVYPASWLASGEPFEFTRCPTIIPPPALFQQFQHAVGDNAVLGLCQIDQDSSGSGFFKERTEGRRNILETLDEQPVADSNSIETAWNFGLGTPVTRACYTKCDYSWTQQGYVHNNWQTHDYVPDSSDVQDDVR